jgi:hypothetical protein
LRLSRIVHARVDISSSHGDPVDELIVGELPQEGTWPAEARHLVHHLNNLVTLYWLTVSGPSEVQIVAGEFCIADAEVSKRAGSTVEVLLRRYAGCLDNQADSINRRIEQALRDAGLEIARGLTPQIRLSGTVRERMAREFRGSAAARSVDRQC